MYYYKHTTQSANTRAQFESTRFAFATIIKALHRAFSALDALCRIYSAFKHGFESWASTPRKTRPTCCEHTIPSCYPGTAQAQSGSETPPCWEASPTITHPQSRSSEPSCKTHPIPRPGSTDGESRRGRSPPPNCSQVLCFDQLRSAQGGSSGVGSHGKLVSTSGGLWSGDIDISPIGKPRKLNNTW